MGNNSLSKNRIRGAGGFAEVSQARLGKAQSPEMLEYVWRPYADVDEENLHAMIRCNMAQTVMLYEQKIISRQEASKILRALRKLQRNPEEFQYDPVRGDLFFNIEAYVIRQVGGAVGGQIHLGRSRIDLLAALNRLKVRKNLTRLIPLVLKLQEVILRRAKETADAVMPAYTHMQPAQVTTFGHYLLAFYDVLCRDLVRLQNAFRSTNVSPLGAAASAGTSWPLDRPRVAELLGFTSVVENTKDAAWNYDWLPEALSSTAILMSNVARVATDFYTWCSYEFALVELDGAFAASSSVMPQKKNPYSLEMIKARTGEVTAAFSAILEVLTKDNGGSTFDIKLVGPRIADNAINRTADMLSLITPIIDTLIVNRVRMAEHAGTGFTTAVALADALVIKRGLSFRTAHHIMGRLVNIATERKLGYQDINSELLDEAAHHIIGSGAKLDDRTIRQALDPIEFVRARHGYGGVALKEVNRMIAKRVKENVKRERSVNDMLQFVLMADKKLANVVDRLTKTKA